MTRKIRLAVVVSHPIQHFVFLYRALAREPDIDLKVFFCSRIGLQSYFDAEMNTAIAWKMDLLSGYDHEFLPEAPRIQEVTWSSIDNPSIASRLSDFKPDAILSYGYATKTAIRVLWFSRQHRVPLLLAGDGDNSTSRSSAKALMRRLTLNVLLRDVAAFLTVGDQNEDMLAGIGIPRSKMFRTPFTIDEHSFTAAYAQRAKRGSEIRSRLGIGQDKIVFLNVGKMSPRKRPLDIAQAASLIAREQPTLASKMHFVFCGDGTQLEELKTRVSQAAINTTLAGFVNVDELPDYFCAADVLLHPSERDPHPLVGSEATAAGLALVLSDRIGLIGPTDIARPGFNALVFPCGNIEALARSIVSVTGDPPLLQKLQAASLQVFAECNLAATLAGIRGALNATTKSFAPV